MAATRDDLIHRFVRDRGHHLGFLRVLCRNPEMAEELFQELSVRVIEKIDTFDAARDFGAWVRGIARNVYLKTLETRYRSAQKTFVYDESLVEEVLAAYESRTAQEEQDKAAHSARLRKCLDQLPDHQRRLLADRYEGNLPMARIAELHRRSVSAVETVLCRVRALLLKCLQRQGAAA